VTRLGGEGTAAPIPHHLQYTIIRWTGSRDQDSTLIWGTERMDDGELVQFLRRKFIDDLPTLAQRILRTTGKLPEGDFFMIERYDCCFVCLERSPCSVMREESKRPAFFKRMWLPGRN
jgi:hypothetical protein